MEKMPSTMKKPPISTPKMKESTIASAVNISTPEKPVQLSLRSRIAFSVKEVKEVALGLQKPHKDPTDCRSDLNGSGNGGWDDDDLLAVEEQLKSSSSNLLQKSSKIRSLIKIPQKYEILVEFFNSMECSIRLLRLKRLLPTFANICSSVQQLTGRRFTYGHLAQLVYIFPEAISIKKVLLRDEATCCMKPELQVYLQTDVAESLNKNEESNYSVLRKLFRRKLVEFSRGHPEADDIPEEELPHPFGPHTKPNIPSDISRDSSCSISINLAADTPHFVTTASHIPQSFQRRFSRKILFPDAEGTSSVCVNEDTSIDDSSVTSVLSQIDCTLKPTSCEKPLFVSPGRSPSSGSRSGDKKLMNADKQSPHKLNHIAGTPARFVSTPERLMTATPAIQTPKRNRLSSAYDTPVKGPGKRSARTKLFSTPQKSAKIEDSKNVTITEDLENVTISVSDDDDVTDILPESLLQEIKEKERKAVEDVDACAAAEVKRRKVMVANLPKLFDMIHLIFQSRNRSTITKQELVDKIISGSSSMVDRSEVEQQLKLLQEVAPDWISAKMVSNGNLLYSVNKISSPQDVRRRLEEEEAK